MELFSSGSSSGRNDSELDLLENTPQSLLRVCRLLHAKNWLAACDGNVSFKESESVLVMTPTARPKAFIREDELARLDVNGHLLSGNPSGEKWMHLEVYRRCPEARAVVHAHPPVAVAWSVARPELKELPADCLSEVVLAVGTIPIVSFQIPGTQEMGTALANYLPQSQVMILARHGALSWGRTLEEAYIGIERLEHAAMTLMYAQSLGGLSRLSPEHYAILSKKRAQGLQRIF